MLTFFSKRQTEPSYGGENPPPGFGLSQIGEWKSMAVALVAGVCISTLPTGMAIAAKSNDQELTIRLALAAERASILVDELRGTIGRCADAMSADGADRGETGLVRYNDVAKDRVTIHFTQKDGTKVVEKCIFEQKYQYRQW